MHFLVLCLLASTAVALKQPALCPNGSGNELVCGVMQPVNAEDSYTKEPQLANTITIGKNGQADFFKTAKALEILRNSLRNKVYDQALNTNNYKWFQTLSKVERQLNDASSGTQKQVSSVASGLKNLQASLDKTVTANGNKAQQTVDDANNKLSEAIDKKQVAYLHDGYKAQVTQCQAPLSKQVELLQSTTSKSVERSYDSLVDLTDQVAMCIQIADLQGKCARDVQTKLNVLRPLGRTSEMNAKKFEDLGKKNFEKDPCLTRALKGLEDAVKNVLRTAPQVTTTTTTTTTATPTTTTPSPN